MDNYAFGPKICENTWSARRLSTGADDEQVIVKQFTTSLKHQQHQNEFMKLYYDTSHRHQGVEALCHSVSHQSIIQLLDIILIQPPPPPSSSANENAIDDVDATDEEANSNNNYGLTLFAAFEYFNPAFSLKNYLNDFATAAVARSLRLRSQERRLSYNSRNSVHDAEISNVAGDNDYDDDNGDDHDNNVSTTHYWRRPKEMQMYRWAVDLISAVKYIHDNHQYLLISDLITANDIYIMPPLFDSVKLLLRPSSSLLSLLLPHRAQQSEDNKSNRNNVMAASNDSNNHADVRLLAEFCSANIQLYYQSLTHFFKSLLFDEINGDDEDDGSVQVTVKKKILDMWSLGAILSRMGGLNREQYLGWLIHYYYKQRHHHHHRQSIHDNYNFNDKTILNTTINSVSKIGLQLMASAAFFCLRKSPANGSDDGSSDLTHSHEHKLLCWTQFGYSLAHLRGPQIYHQLFTSLYRNDPCHVIESQIALAKNKFGSCGLDYILFELPDNFNNFINNNNNNSNMAEYSVENKGDTIVHAATRLGRAEHVKLFLQLFYNNNSLPGLSSSDDFGGVKASVKSPDNTETSICRLLNRSGETILHSCAASGQSKVAQVILEFIIETTTRKTTATASAANNNGNSIITDFVNAQDLNYSRTALHFAVVAAATAAGTSLSSGLTVDNNTRSNIRPYSVNRYSSSCHRHSNNDAANSVNQSLYYQHYPEQFNNGNNSGSTNDNRYLLVAELLLRYGADIDLADRTGYTPFHLTCQRGHVAMAKLLLSHRNNEILAAEADKTSDHVALVNRVTFDGWCSSPLHLAVQNGHVEMIRWLLKVGADPKAVDAAGRLPQHTLVVVDMLREKRDFLKQLAKFGLSY